MPGKRSSNTSSAHNGNESPSDQENQQLPEVVTYVPQPHPAKLADPTGRRLIAAQRKRGFYAADRVIFIYRPAIHTPHIWEPGEGGEVEGFPVGPTQRTRIVDSEPSATHAPSTGPSSSGPSSSGSSSSGAERSDNASRRRQVQLVALKPDLTPATAQDEQAIIASACEVAEHIEGPVAGRIVRILYRIANDPPYWRHPRITVDINELLDTLGYDRDSRRYHTSLNRARVRDILNALARVEIRGERFDGAGNREVFRAPLLYIRGGSYGQEETAGLQLSQILEQGLPRALHLELGWYEGVRRAETGELGNNYLLLPHELAQFHGAGQADHHATEDRLLDFLWTRYSLARGKSPTIALTLGVALDRAGITNRNLTRARQTLAKALDHLKQRHLIAEYTPLPVRRSSTFSVTLREPTPLATLWDTVAMPEAAATKNTASDSHSPGDASAATTSPDRSVPATSRGGEAADITHPSDDIFSDEAPTDSEVDGELLTPQHAFFTVLRVGGQVLSARQVWESLHTNVLASQRIGDGLKGHLAHLQPLWRAETEPDGDMSYALYLGVSPALLFRMESEVDWLRSCAHGFLPGFPYLYDLIMGPTVPEQDVTGSSS